MTASAAHLGAEHSAGPKPPSAAPGCGGTEVDAAPDPGTEEPADDQQPTPGTNSPPADIKDPLPGTERPTPGTYSPPADIEGPLPATERPTPGTNSPPADIEQPLAGVDAPLAERTLTSPGPNSADSVVPAGERSSAGDRASVWGRERGVAVTPAGAIASHRSGGDDAGAAGETGGSARPPAFEVRLVNFEGPFDLLLSLISKHQLDVTEVALSRVTDEFIVHIRALGSSWDLGQATEFLVVAATLLDLKAARLLPSAEVEDEEDLALLEARDLLFARLLQYRAYKQVAAHFRQLETEQARRFPRSVPLEPRFAELMPEVLLTVTPEQLARIAAEALRPKPPPAVSMTHLHAARVSVREHASILRERLARSGQSTFRALTQDCQHTVELVARFLALLELYREGAVAFDQVAPLGELWVRWTGNADAAEPIDGQDVDEDYG